MLQIQIIHEKQFLQYSNCLGTKNLTSKICSCDMIWHKQGHETKSLCSNYETHNSGITDLQNYKIHGYEVRDLKT
jgi:hypothetical protein